MFFDSHCHLNDDRLRSDIPLILERAKIAQVEGMVEIAACFCEFQPVLNCAERYPNIWASLGIHPSEACADNPSFETLLSFYAHPKVVAVGEAGFDFYQVSLTDTFQAQRDLFLTQIHLAQALKKPLVIHTREAEKETRDLIQSEFKNQPFSFILHCYTGSLDFAKEMLDLGGFVSASGVITFKKSEVLQEVFAALPLSALLIETDAPYLAPVPYRGGICEPAFVVETAKKLAEIKKLSLEEVAFQTTKNAKKVFGLDL